MIRAGKLAGKEDFSGPAMQPVMTSPTQRHPIPPAHVVKAIFIFSELGLSRTKSNAQNLSVEPFLKPMLSDP